MVAVVLRVFENAIDLKLCVFYGTLIKSLDVGLANAKADVCTTDVAASEAPPYIGTG